MQGVVHVRVLGGKVLISAFSGSEAEAERIHLNSKILLLQNDFLILFFQGVQRILCSRFIHRQNKVNWNVFVNPNTFIIDTD